MPNALHLTPLTQAAYDRLGPTLTRDDPAAGHPIARLLASTMNPTEDAAQPLLVGWSAILDPARCPKTWLPWLAQALGETIHTDTPEDQARARLANPPGWTAGTPVALTMAVAATLTGTRRVEIAEHHNDDPWHVKITTYRGETPDPAATLTAAKDAVEAGLIVTHEVATGWTWRNLAETGLTWRDVSKLTVEQLRRVIPGTTADEIRRRYP